MNARTTIARVLTGLGLLAGIAITTDRAQAAGHTFGTPGSFNPICHVCLFAHMPELLATRYNWDGYQEVDVFGRNFTPNTVVQFTITDAVTGEQIATSLGWSGATGYLTSFPGSGYPEENGTGIFDIPLDNCGGYGHGGVNIQAYDPASNLWSNIAFYNAACF